ncbi:SURF1 family protein [Nocardia sp. CDC159]|uniref:SURF1-like protein n=1 Tax=Nocardia pulmonis TaxID=2951408 RepID=A0A9X2E4I3_9NOCA|nr:MULTISPECIES: SURF1 family cytochrome oxidase biogenesis protein [Nocardia]MCM6773481.1 SURF1 family protein [Nocardia pulmonis]MCM6786368.1 SURF1 family protein [Nocardia sp. CDC159]
MRRLTFLLRPSWAILAVVVVAFAYLCFTILAPWQLGKNSSTSHRNKLIAASVEAAPVDVTTLLADPGATDTEWRRVIATGTYVPGSTVVERLQRLNDNPAYGVLATFRLTDGRVLLVDRGLLAAADGIRLPQVPEPPAGEQRIEARIRKSEGVTPGKDPMTQDGYRQVYSIDTGQLATVLGSELTAIPTGGPGGYLQLTEGQPGAFTPRPLPQLDAGPYLSYGLQWIAFGIMAPLGLGYFVYAELRERRRERATPTREPVPTETSLPPSDLAPTTESPTPPKPSPPRERTNADRLADRYGNTRR